MTLHFKQSFELTLVNGKYYLYHRILFNGNKIRFSTGISVADKDLWDKDDLRILGKDKQVKLDNTTIANLISTTDKLFVKYDLKDSYPSKDVFKKDYLKLQGKEVKEKKTIAKADIPISQAIEDFIASENTLKQWSEAIPEQFRNLAKHFSAWDKTVSLNMLNQDTLTSFITYLTSSKGANLHNSTAEKRWSQLKWFLRWCNRTNYFKNNLYDTFQPKFKQPVGEKEIIYLTKDELRLWVSHQFLPGQEHLERVRDVFAFCCFTGLRHSDVKNLRHQDIIDDVIHLVTVKTGDRITINLNIPARQILEKYKDYDKSLALPVTADQPMNRYLKEIGKLLNINTPIHHTYYKGNKRFDTVTPKYEKLSTHTGRKTFVVTAMTLGMDINVIMKFTGHSSLGAMKPYMHVVDEIKKKEMEKFDNIF